ncbi:MAG: glycerophosphodiester phosphodiesterase [Halobacteriales archaeon]
MRSLQRIAHRGYAGAAPENTVAAARCAANHDADWVEIDVLPTGDDDVVVFHDSRLDGGNGSRGITDGSGVVWETPTTEVMDAEVLDSGETIPTLRMLCERLPADMGLNVELKHCGALELRTETVLDPDTRDTRAAIWRPFVEDVLTALEGFSGEVLFSSFAEGALAALRTQAPSASLAPIVNQNVTAAFELASRYDATAIHPSVRALGIREPGSPDGSPTTRPIKRAHTEGYAVNVWTVRTWYQAHQLSIMNVDGLIADYPLSMAWRD